jgi:hypothetical protein
MCNPDFQHLHYWEKRPKGTCVWCLYILRRQRVLGKAVKCQAKRSYSGCVFCNINLFKEGECWTRFHGNNVYC